MVKKYSIEDMGKIAKNRGGRCLANDYVNVRTTLKWKCSANHVGEATPSTVKRGTWYPTWAGRWRL